MALPSAVLFPNALMPLFIFEPRYRAMLAHSLEHDRMFCIGHMRPGVTEAHTLADLYPIAGLGLVRACVGREDGTSNLVLQGIARVRLGGVVQETPFQMTEILALAAHPAPPEEARELSVDILELCSGLEPGVNAGESLHQQLANIADPEVLADVVAHTFLRDPHARQQVLEVLPVHERLETLIRYLRSEAGQMM